MYQEERLKRRQLVRNGRLPPDSAEFEVRGLDSRPWSSSGKPNRANFKSEKFVIIYDVMLKSGLTVWINLKSTGFIGAFFIDDGKGNEPSEFNPLSTGRFTTTALIGFLLGCSAALIDGNNYQTGII